MLVPLENQLVREGVHLDKSGPLAAFSTTCQTRRVLAPKA